MRLNALVEIDKVEFMPLDKACKAIFFSTPIIKGSTFDCSWSTTERYNAYKICHSPLSGVTNHVAIRTQFRVRMTEHVTTDCICRWLTVPASLSVHLYTWVLGQLWPS